MAENFLQGLLQYPAVSHSSTEHCIPCLENPKGQGSDDDSALVKAKSMQTTLCKPLQICEKYCTWACKLQPFYQGTYKTINKHWQECLSTRS